MMRTRKTKLILAVATVLAVASVWHWAGRSKSEANDADLASTGTGEVVAPVARVQRGTIDNSLTISGTFKPFQEVDVHAKVAGYIRTIYVDVGSHAKDGQTLAVLEVPELAAEFAGASAAVRRSEQEIHRAQSDVERAKSAHSAAHTMYERLNQASQQRAGLVAQQEVDDAQAKDLEGEAQVSSATAALNAAEQALAVAEANQKQYSALANYTRIVAPFTGVITVRYADTGSLISAGTASSTQSTPVVRLAEVSKLRLVLPIPESIATQIHLGDPVRVHVSALHQDIVGRVSRFASALDLQTRTMETEIDFENKDGKLMPGMYAETVLDLAESKESLVIPLEALAQNNGEATVLIVNSQNLVEARHVKIGLQGKSRVAVLSGLSENERVIVGNRSQFRPGERVVSKEVQLPDANMGGAN